MKDGQTHPAPPSSEEKTENPFYLYMNILFFVLLPLLASILEWLLQKETMDLALMGKWFIFWAIGVRLFSAGIKQASDPAYTAKQIFNMRGEESFVVIRELGFANIGMGLGGILSLFHSDWRPITAIIGGIFFGLAGFQHLFRKPANRKETIATIADLFVFFVTLIYLLSGLF